MIPMSFLPGSIFLFGKNIIVLLIILIVSILALLVGKELLCSGQELQCNQYHNEPLCSGDIVTSTCSIQSPFLLWIIETTSEGDFEIDFDRGDNIGIRESSGPITANLTKHYPDPSTDVSESILQYTFSEKLAMVQVWYWFIVAPGHCIFSSLYEQS